MKEYEDMKEIRERLDNNVKKLAKNVSALGKDTLKSEYKTAYTKLMDQIKTDTGKYVNGIVFSVMVPSSKSEVIIKQLQSDFTKSLQKDVITAVYNEYDLEKLDEICTLYNQRLCDMIENMS